MSEAPLRKLVADGDRIIDPQLLRGPADVVELALERELGRVDADHDQSMILVSLRPRADIAL
jgi:hypothetical protein